MIRGRLQVETASARGKSGCVHMPQQAPWQANGQLGKDCAYGRKPRAVGLV